MRISNAALLLIDVQKGFDDPMWGQRNNPEAEANMSKILQVWRRKKWPVIYVQHISPKPNHPLREDQPGSALKEVVQPLEHEPIIRKHVNSAFIGTNLQKHLTDIGCTQLVIVGLTTDHCVSVTARMAGNYHFDTYVIADACATFDRKGYDGKTYDAQQIHEANLASLHGMFATVMDTEALLTNI